MVRGESSHLAGLVTKRQCVVEQQLRLSDR